MNDRRRWGDAEQSLYDALTLRLGRPSGSQGGRSSAAFREASRRLADEGIDRDDLDVLLRDYALAALKASGPMPLAGFLRHGEANGGYLLVARWVSSCAGCGSEIARGSLCWYRRGPEKGYVICGDCEAVDYASGRADLARRRALERDDDGEQLQEAILAQTPRELHAQVEDSLPILQSLVAREE